MTYAAPPSGQKKNKSDLDAAYLYDNKLFKLSDDDDSFSTSVKDYANPFKSRWYASILSTSNSIGGEEQDDSDDDTENVHSGELTLRSSSLDTESDTCAPQVEHMPSSKALTKYAYIRYPTYRYNRRNCQKQIHDTLNDGNYFSSNNYAGPIALSRYNLYFSRSD